MKCLNYYFRFLCKNTKYMTLCICMLFIGLLFTIAYIPDFNRIEGSFMSFSHFMPFFMNTTNRIFYVIFMLVMPLIVSIPIADIIKLENNCQYHILSRYNKRTVLLSKIVVSFFCGFSLYFIVLAGSILFSHIIFHQGNMDFYSYSTFFVPNNQHLVKLILPFYNLLLSNPFLASVVHTLIISLLGGFLSLLTLSVGLHFKSLLVTYCFSFIVTFCGNVLSFVFPGIVDLFDPIGFASNKLLYLIIYFVVLILINSSSLIYYIKKDVY